MAPTTGDRVQVICPVVQREAASSVTTELHTKPLWHSSVCMHIYYTICMSQQGLVLLLAAAVDQQRWSNRLLTFLRVNKEISVQHVFAKKKRMTPVCCVTDVCPSTRRGRERAVRVGPRHRHIVGISWTWLAGAVNFVSLATSAIFLAFHVGEGVLSVTFSR